MNRQPDGASIQSSDPLSFFEPVIGLEVHCQLSTVTKLFCGCSTSFGALPNHNTCPICLGLPGVLPVLNHTAVNHALKMALAVGCRIDPSSVFARKQYFYPDLPKGYQITQYDRPYATGGKVVLPGGILVRIMRIHLEEDAGKTVHGDHASYVDLNRAGIPLIEIVSEPDIHSAEDAATYLRKLRTIVRHLEISDGNLEEGSFRCDANVSVRRRGTTVLGTRCEIKNLNSFKNVERAIRYEILRQIDMIQAGEPIEQQTLQFDAASGKTKAMRSKEESHDYRYVADPDLGYLKIAEERIQKTRENLPELPDAMAQRYMRDFDLTIDDAAILTSDRELARYYESTLEHVANNVTPKITANWILGEFLRESNERDWNLDNAPIPPEAMAELLVLLGKETISGKIAKKVFQIMVEKGGRPEHIVRDEGLVQITDRSAVEALVCSILDAHRDQVEAYLAGKDKIFGFFVGQVMKASRGRMNPGIVNEVLKDQLERRRS